MTRPRRTRLPRYTIEDLESWASDGSQPIGICWTKAKIRAVWERAGSPKKIHALLVMEAAAAVEHNSDDYNAGLDLNLEHFAWCMVPEQLARKAVPKVRFSSLTADEVYAWTQNAEDALKKLSKVAC